MAPPSSASPERPQCALLGGALVLWFGVNAGNGASPALGPVALIGVLTLGAPVLVAALWLWTTRGAAAPDARLARNAALVTLAAPLPGCLATLAWPPEQPANPSYGIARTASVLVLAYAILRHQLLGLDVKVKWTLQQSTVAAAFIGVFFVVSESAALVFRASVGPFLGIAAAGLLLFALAPLQRVAERVASASRARRCRA